MRSFKPSFTHNFHNLSLINSCMLIDTCTKSRFTRKIQETKNHYHESCVKIYGNRSVVSFVFKLKVAFIYQSSIYIQKRPSFTLDVKGYKSCIHKYVFCFT